MAWGKTAEFISKYFKTGQLIMISGTLVNENYEKDGVKYYTHKIVVNQAEFAGYNKSEFKTNEPNISTFEEMTDYEVIC